MIRLGNEKSWREKHEEVSLRPKRNPSDATNDCYFCFDLSFCLRFVCFCLQKYSVLPLQPNFCLFFFQKSFWKQCVWHVFDVTLLSSEPVLFGFVDVWLAFRRLFGGVFGLSVREVHFGTDDAHFVGDSCFSDACDVFLSVLFCAEVSHVCHPAWRDETCVGG